MEKLLLTVSEWSFAQYQQDPQEKPPLPARLKNREHTLGFTCVTPDKIGLHYQYTFIFKIVIMDQDGVLT